MEPEQGPGKACEDTHARTHARTLFVQSVCGRESGLAPHLGPSVAFKLEWAAAVPGCGLACLIFLSFPVVGGVGGGVASGSKSVAQQVGTSAGEGARIMRSSSAATASRCSVAGLSAATEAGLLGAEEGRGTPSGGLEMLLLMRARALMGGG
eukprot:662975-Pelagomonas_calceolata.AAC.4